MSKRTVPIRKAKSARSFLSIRLETPRLLLSCPRTEDIDAIFSLAKDRSIHRYLMLPLPYQRSHARDFTLLARHENAKAVGCHVVIRRRDDDEILGVVSLRHIHSVHRRSEIGYWLGRAHWGQGYAQEAVGAVLKFAFGPLRLHKIYAHTLLGNVRSERLLTLLRFQQEGILRGEIKSKGRWRDLKRWGALRESRPLSKRKP